MIPTFVVEVTRATETPHSNTGLNRQDPHGTGISVGLDYLVLTGSGDIDELMKIIWAGTGTSFDTDKIRGGFRGVWYDRILASSSTIELAVRHNHDEPQFPKYRLSIPGKPLRAMLADTLMSFCDSLKAFGAVATRFDWAIDDYDRQISLSVFEEAGRNNNVFGCTEMGVTERRKFAQTQRTPTIYFGSTQSDKFVRIYDKFLESKGKIDAIRYEVQWRNKYASRVFFVFIIVVVICNRGYNQCPILRSVQLGLENGYHQWLAGMSPLNGGQNLSIELERQRNYRSESYSEKLKIR
jgi:hypothetical protein